MRPVLTVEEMRRVDAEATMPVDVLMDRAGFALAREAASMGVGYGSIVHVLCGSGNNGGDGYVAARYLAGRGAAVHAHHLGLPDPGSAASRAMMAAADSGVRIGPLGEPRSGDLIIDALFGTGFRGALPADVVPWTLTPMHVLAADIPSGLHGDSGVAIPPTFTADRTVTFHALKPGHLIADGPDLCGSVTVADIGLEGGEPVMRLAEPGDVEVPTRSRHVHKWKAGAVATVGGVPGLTGAALLCSRAAMAAGAGVSILLTTAATTATYEALAPDIPTMQASETGSWRGHASEVLGLLERFDVLVVGPGLEPTPPDFLEQLLEAFDGTMIVDAGAVTAISRLDSLLERTAPTILTPHAGEFTRFSGLDPTWESAARIAAGTGSIVLLKGAPTFVAGVDVTAVSSGGPELASIGTGDVLAGIIAALVARGVDPERAAWTGAYLHGVAGRTLESRRTVTATGLVDVVAEVMANVEAAMRPSPSRSEGPGRGYR